MTTEIRKYNRAYSVIIYNLTIWNNGTQGVLPRLLCGHSSTNTFSSNIDLSKENIEVQAA